MKQKRKRGRNTAKDNEPTFVKKIKEDVYEVSYFINQKKYRVSISPSQCNCRCTCLPGERCRHKRHIQNYQAVKEENKKTVEVEDFSNLKWF